MRHIALLCALFGASCAPVQHDRVRVEHISDESSNEETSVSPTDSPNNGKMPSSEEPSVSPTDSLNGDGSVAAGGALGISPSIGPDGGRRNDTVRPDTLADSMVAEKLCDAYVGLTLLSRKQSIALSKELVGQADASAAPDDYGCFSCTAALTCPMDSDCVPYYACVERNCLTCDQCGAMGCECIAKCFPAGGSCLLRWIETAQCLTDACKEPCEE